MLKKLILTTGFAALLGFAQAQQNDILPQGFAPGEEALIPAYMQSRYAGANDRATILTPPGGDIRTMAGWEELEALTITWTGYPAILREIVREAQTQCKVIIHCTDSNVVKTNLSNYSIPLTSNLKFIEVAYNSIWIRDYGANTVYRNDVDSIFLVDWIYNRPRPADDDIPVAYAALLGIDLYRTLAPPYELVNTGGNFLTDGMGTYFASELEIEENAPGNSYYSPGKDTNEVKDMLLDWMGLDRYYLMETLPYDGIHHIDMHMKLLDETTMLVGEFPVGVSDGPQLEANIQYLLSGFNTAFGTPYKVVRIPMPPSTGGNYAPSANYRTYTNFTFVNKSIIMPLYRTQYDTTAIRIIKENCPGYTIKTIDADNASGNPDLDQNIISQSGVIHCITHFVGVDDPLLIQHGSLTDTYDNVNPYTVNAFIKHTTGISSANLYWTTDTLLPWNNVSMTLTNASTDQWSGNIPAQAMGTTIYYYIEGNATNGKTQVRPIVAPDGWYHFKVLFSSANIEENLGGVFSAGLFPNPSHGITCIPFHTDRALSGKIYVTDLNGKMVQEIYQGDFKMGDSKFFINTETWSAGVYMVVAATNEGTMSQKLVVR
jgi:agmatine/peptidylarginine deiminase